MEDVGIFHGHLVDFPVTWHILWPFGTFFPVLVCCSKKNLATLIVGGFSRQKCKMATLTFCRVLICIRSYVAIECTQASALYVHNHNHRMHICTQASV
jgi:hypothetical protein